MTQNHDKIIITKANYETILPSFLLYGYEGTLVKAKIKAYYKEKAKDLSGDVMSQANVANIDPQLMEIILKDPNTMKELTEVVKTIEDAEKELDKITDESDKKKLQKKITKLKGEYENMALELITRSPEAIGYLMNKKKKDEIKEELEREEYLEGMLDKALESFIDMCEFDSKVAISPSARMLILEKIVEEPENEFLQQHIDFFTYTSKQS